MNKNEISNIKFEAVDFVIFALVLSVSLFIGLYYAVKRNLGKYFKKFYKRVDDTETEEIKEYLTASSSMNILPIALSLLATNFSGNVLLGFPAETYQYGMQYFVASIGVGITPLIGAFITGPMFAKLKVTSVFEYFKLRYNSNLIRLFAVLCYAIRIIVSTSMYIFGPATTLNALTPISTITSILVIGCVATFYTAIGGIKAVIWTDVFQLTIMFIGMGMVIVKGIIDIGFTDIWRISNENGRLNFFDFDPDPLIRQSFWSLVFGSMFQFIMQYGIDQQMIQRFQSAKTPRKAQVALLINIPGIIFLFFLCCFTGLVIFSSYENCDPLSGPNKINNPNQLLPYYVSDRLSILNGAIGLFFAAILSGALSSVSSTLNSLAAILWEDFLKNFNYFKNLSDHKSTIVTKLLVVFGGIVCTALALFFTTTTGNIIQISGALNGAIAAPIVGLFIQSALFESSNKFGASFGILSGLVIGLWLSVGQTIMKPEYQKLNIGIDCYMNETHFPSLINKTNINYNTKQAWNLHGFDKVYSISYPSLAFTGTFATVMIGLITSLLTCGYKQRIDKSLLLFRYRKRSDSFNLKTF